MDATTPPGLLDTRGGGDAGADAGGISEGLERAPRAGVKAEAGGGSEALCQYMTPLWLAEALVSRHFPQLDGRDIVLEPSCGMGAFLKAVPAWVPAIGVEIDDQLAAIAREETGRAIITGDFLTVDLGVRPTAIIGNPPFRVDLIGRFLTRAHQLLPEGARAGFLLPAYAMQTSRRVADYLELWSIAAEIIPRDAFPRLREPLIFAVFSKDIRKILVGVALINEAADVLDLPEPYRTAVRTTRGSLWRQVCEIALRRLGGEAGLADIYRELERARPTRNNFWREKIRQVLRTSTTTFKALGDGRYALA